MSSNYEKIRNRLKRNPSYILRGEHTKFCKIHGFDKDEVLNVIKELRAELAQEKGHNSFKEFLKNNDLKLEDVRKVKFWQNFSGDYRFSVDTKTEWYENTEEIINELKELIKTYQKPTHKPIIEKGKGDSVVVINLYDAHIDKLVLVDETNPSGSVDANCSVFEDAFDKLLSQSIVYQPETIIFPIGNDFFNANDGRNTTLKGTPQDSNPFWKKSFIKGYETLRRCIDKASIYAKVKVVLVISNHDADKLFFLGQMINATYEYDKNIEVDTSTASRKYIQYGINLLGFSHGNYEKNYLSTLPATIMIENKNIMPKIDYIHHFCGDIHHKETYQSLSTKDLKGCTISFLRALSEIGKWEYQEGYVGIPKTAESYIFVKDKGLSANLLVHI